MTLVPPAPATEPTAPASCTDGAGPAPAAPPDQAGTAVPEAAVPAPRPEATAPTPETATGPGPDPAPSRGAAPAAPGAAQTPRTRPRFGTVPLAGPSRAGAARRRGDVPSVRAVRLTDEPPAPVERAAAPAAVTPVPLPVPPPAVRAVPTENRPEEPQP
ncbi:hypothetical protein ACIGW0_31835 [Streptomyces bikiniensis]|uniref:Uncharacterized protein n=1 Tax=Streptomyces bikiniensis TaxID=1896 RepID=A0ABW8D5K3_STRBI